MGCLLPCRWQRDLDMEARSTAWYAIQGKGAIQLLRPLAHGAQTQMAGERAARFRALERCTVWSPLSINFTVLY
jgi:hypothetical protein